MARRRSHLLGQVVEQLPPLSKIHAYVQLGRRLKRRAQRDDERVVQLEQDLALSEDVGGGVLGEHALGYYLHGEVEAGVLRLAEEDLAEGAAA